MAKAPSSLAGEERADRNSASSSLLEVGLDKRLCSGSALSLLCSMSCAVLLVVRMPDSTFNVVQKRQGQTNGKEGNKREREILAVSYKNPKNKKSS